MKIYKYQVENELINLKEVPLKKFEKAMNETKERMYKIIFHKKKCKCLKCNHEFAHEKRYFIKCPRCKTTLRFIYKNNVIEKESKYLTYLEKNKRNDLIIRCFFFEVLYIKESQTFEERLLEVARINLDYDVYMLNNTGITFMGHAYHYHSDKPFKRSIKKTPLNFDYSNIVNRQTSIFKNTKYRYYNFDLAKKYQIDLISWIDLRSKCPRSETLIKCKKITQIKNLMRYSNRHSYKRINNLSPKQFRMYLKYEMSIKQLYTMYDLDLDNYDLVVKASYINLAHTLYNNLNKIVDYVYKNKVTIDYYDDYLRSARILNYDMTDNKVLFPKNLKQKHDEYSSLIKIKKSEATDNAIKKFANELEKEFKYNNINFLIRPIKDFQELINESDQLCHCVKDYAKRIAERETSIFVVRSTFDETKPLATLELKNKRVVQCRSKYNKKPDADVVDFVNNWCNKFKLKTCFEA